MTRGPHHGRLDRAEPLAKPARRTRGMSCVRCGVPGGTVSRDGGRTAARCGCPDRRRDPADATSDSPGEVTVIRDLVYATGSTPDEATELKLTSPRCRERGCTHGHRRGRGSELAVCGRAGRVGLRGWTTRTGGRRSRSMRTRRPSGRWRRPWPAPSVSPAGRSTAARRRRWC